MFNLDIEFFKNVAGKNLLSCFESSEINEIIVNSNGDLIIEDKASKRKIDEVNQNDMLHFLSLLAEYRGVYLNKDNPTMCVALPYEKPFSGARIQAIVPPVVNAPSLTIRKHLKREISLDSYVESGTMPQSVYDFLSDSIANYRNIIISGQPNSGKTTLTLACLSQIAKVSNAADRILLLEDKPELLIPMNDVQALVVTNTVDMTSLVRCAMSMRPDRIIVGEVTDKAALAMLKAWNTGSSGGISTLHANNNRATLQRLLDLCCENKIEPPISLITTTVDVLVHIERCSIDESITGRRITEVSELKGYDYKNKSFQLNPIYQSN